MLLASAHMVKTDADGEPISEDVRCKGLMLGADNSTFERLCQLIGLCWSLRKDQARLGQWSEMHAVMMCSALRLLKYNFIQAPKPRCEFDIAVSGEWRTNRMKTLFLALVCSFLFVLVFFLVCFDFAANGARCTR